MKLSRFPFYTVRDLVLDLDDFLDEHRRGVLFILALALGFLLGWLLR